MEAAEPAARPDRRSPEMNQQPSTLDRLGLAGWQAGDRAAAGATLGSLTTVLGDFRGGPRLRVVVPAQRLEPLAEATTG
jgi:hypothetical protein